MAPIFVVLFMAIIGLLFTGFVALFVVMVVSITRANARRRQHGSQSTNGGTGELSGAFDGDSGLQSPSLMCQETRHTTILRITTRAQIYRWRHRTRNIITRAVQTWAGIITAADSIPAASAVGIMEAGSVEATTRKRLK